MHFTTNSWREFQNTWDGPHNFLMTGETVPFEFDFPSIDRVVDELRADEMVNVNSGTRGDTLLKDNIVEQFRALPIDKAVESSFGLAHYKLSRFDVPGKFLHGFEKRVLDPWRNALAANGYTFERCYPIIFISGPGCATNYHMDFSHVLAWQIVGQKKFCGLKQPNRWAPHDARVGYNPSNYKRPEGITDADALCYDMKPGDVLWNILLTPHWVEASAGIAMSVNLSHGGLRLHGRLSPNERDLEDHRAKNPDAAPGKLKAAY